MDILFSFLSQQYLLNYFNTTWASDDAYSEADISQTSESAQRDLDAFIRQLEVEKKCREENPTNKDLKRLIRMLAEGWKMKFPIDADTQKWIDGLQETSKSDIEQERFDAESYQIAAKLSF